MRKEINMKNLFLFIILVSVVFPLLAQSDSPSSSFAIDFVPVWARAQAYTLEVAEAMPAEQYDYRANEEVMTFGEQLVHITGNLYGLSSRFITEEKSSYKKPKAEDMSKTEIISQLQEAFAYVSNALETMSDTEMQSVAPGFWAKEPTNKSVIFLLMRDHMTHHRAQLILYLRMNGIKPPGYRGW